MNHVMLYYNVQICQYVSTKWRDVLALVMFRLVLIEYMTYITFANKLQKQGTVFRTVFMRAFIDTSPASSE